LVGEITGLELERKFITYEGNDKCIKNFGLDIDHYGDQDIDQRIILKSI
jgi:hypothetical protein